LKVLKIDGNPLQSPSKYLLDTAIDDPEYYDYFFASFYEFVNKIALMIVGNDLSSKSSILRLLKGIYV
jgi:hypothetical protein